MTMVKQYKTGMWIVEDPKFYKQKFNGSGWSLIFHKDDSEFPKFQNGKEIIIQAKNWKTAQQATNLIYASLVLILGDTLGGILNKKPVAFSEEEDLFSGMPKRLIGSIKDTYLHTPDLSIACLVALKVSRNKRHCYALAKYCLSCEIYSTPAIELDPFHSENLKLSPFFEDHIRFAACIILAYSSIEDLDLQIKASNENPSRLNNGEWNPAVKADIEERLTAAGINLDEFFLWTVRGTSRRINKKRPLKSKSKPYKLSRTVRDSEVNIIDALNDASWLRSKIAAHGSGKLTPSLSPYDVANVQHLARRLIMETLGFWRFKRNN